MRAKLLILAAVFVLALVGLWIGCSHDSTVAPVDQPLVVEGDAGAALFDWAIGPIEGITTVWHPTPHEITVPVGTTLRFKCGGTPSSKIEWNNAMEVSRGTLGSIAECHIDAPGRQEISVVFDSDDAVGGENTSGDQIQIFSDYAGGGGGNRELWSRRTCIVNGVAVGVNQVGVVAIEPRVVPLTLTESSSSYETMKVFSGGNAISQFRRIERDHYRTAVNRPVALGATLSDPHFASIIETRISGERPILGAESIDFEKPGRYTVSVGPPVRAKSFIVETYSVSIMSHLRGRDFVRDGEPVTFVAKTDPPGHEDEITWLSSTKYGEAHPVVGHGPSFTVEFQSTSGGDSWRGVRADNGVFSQDGTPPPPPITREQAKQLIIDNVIAGHPNEADLVAFSYPVSLSSGIIVKPVELDGGGEAMTVSDWSWFFYINLTPELGFQHPTLFALVSGTYDHPILQTAEQGWWPVINGTEVYVDGDIGVPSSPDIFYGAYPPPYPSCTSAIVLERGNHFAAPSLLPQVLWAIRAQGTGYSSSNTDKMRGVFKNQAGVPDANNKLWVFDAASLANAVQQANDACASCVYVYISSHGINSTPRKLQTRVGVDLTSAALADILDNLKACSVVVIIDACYSGAFLDDVLNALKNRPEPLKPHSPSTCWVFSSADANSQSTTNSAIGSYWTDQLAKCWADVSADTDGSGAVDAAEAFAWVLSNGCTKAKVANPQWTGLSAITCGGSLEPVSRLSGLESR